MVLYAIFLLILILWELDTPELYFLVNGELGGWQVDVYTQKDPYSGAGIGEPSDSFAAHQIVILHANVTYNMFPVQNVPVSFSVQGPLNSVQNYSLFIQAVTDHSGVAQTNFTLPWLIDDPETVTFGFWKVTAYAKNASDYLVFEVGWIVDLDSLHILEYDPPQGGWIETQISLTNICLTSRNATLALTSYDSLRRILKTFITEEIVIHAGRTNFSAQLHIPYWAAPGIATINVSVYTPEGDPYSPTTLSATFLISLLGDLNNDYQVDMQDIGIASLAYGSHPESERWNPLADLNKDGKIDITDIALIAKNFGQSYL